MKTRLYAGTINRRYPEPGWINVHLDITDRGVWDPELEMNVLPEVVADIAKELPMFRDGMFHEIVCHHVLEHLTVEQATHATRAFHRVLVEGGVLDLETPDVDMVCKAWAERKLDLPGLQQWLYGEYLGDDADLHRTAYTMHTLNLLVVKNGFEIAESFYNGYAATVRAVRA